MDSETLKEAISSLQGSLYKSKGLNELSNYFDINRHKLTVHQASCLDSSELYVKVGRNLLFHSSEVSQFMHLLTCEEENVLRKTVFSKYMKIMKLKSKVKNVTVNRFHSLHRIFKTFDYSSLVNMLFNKRKFDFSYNKFLVNPPIGVEEPSCFENIRHPLHYMQGEPQYESILRCLLKSDDEEDLQQHQFEVDSYDICADNYDFDYS